MVQFIQNEISSIGIVQSIKTKINNIENRINKFENKIAEKNLSFNDLLKNNMENKTGNNNINNYSLNSFYSLVNKNNNISNYLLENNNQTISNDSYIINNNDNIINFLNQLKFNENNNDEIEKIENQSNLNKSLLEKIKNGVKDLNLFKDIVNIAKKLSEEIGVDPNLINTIIKVESNFNPAAISKAGAIGLMQLMPSTANSLGVEDPYDIYQNLKGGITLIKTLLNSFDGNLKLALAAYNAGAAKVKEYGDIPPIEETQNYVNKILSIYNS